MIVGFRAGMGFRSISGVHLTPTKTETRKTQEPARETRSGEKEKPVNLLGLPAFSCFGPADIDFEEMGKKNYRIKE
ncbi:MAG: hypothetical protein ACOCUF_03620 [Patescibacteria group bacterium]